MYPLRLLLLCLTLYIIAELHKHPHVRTLFLFLAQVRRKLHTDDTQSLVEPAPREFIDERGDARRVLVACLQNGKIEILLAMYWRTQSWSLGTYREGRSVKGDLACEDTVDRGDTSQTFATLNLREHYRNQRNLRSDYTRPFNVST